jgi:hypothetical protein
VSAVLAFIFSLIRANSETVLSTRLNQEMRATMALIASDMRRARGLAIRSPRSARAARCNNPFANVDLSTAGCARYSYAEDIAAAPPITAPSA